jgi:hypothetical protein
MIAVPTLYQRVLAGDTPVLEEQPGRRRATALLDGVPYLLKGHEQPGEIEREAAAHAFARRVSVLPVPEAHLIEHEWGPALAVRLIDGDVLDEMDSIRVFALGTVLAYAMGDSSSRHRWNYIRDRDGEVWAIDFGGCFYDVVPYALFAGMLGQIYTKVWADTRPFYAQEIIEQVRRIQAVPPDEWLPHLRPGAAEALADRIAGLADEVRAFWHYAAD